MAGHRLAIGISPLAAAGNALYQIVAQRELDRKAAEKEARDRAIEDQKTALEGRRVAVDEGALNEQIAARLGKPAPTPARRVLTNIKSANGEPVTRVVDESNGSTVADYPEYQAPKSETGWQTVQGQDAAGQPIWLRVNPELNKIEPLPAGANHPTVAPKTETGWSVQSAVGPDGKLGFVRINATDGRVEPMSGDFHPAASNKPPNGAQTQALDYYQRAKSALEDMAAVEDQVSPKDLSIIMHSPSFTPDWIKQVGLSGPGQQYSQALLSYMLAKLRKESGAAISAGEFAAEAKKAARDIGDTPDTLEQKRRSRAQVLEGYAMQAGPAYEDWYGTPYRSPAQNKQRKLVVKNGVLTWE